MSLQPYEQGSTFAMAPEQQPPLSLAELLVQYSLEPNRQPKTERLEAPINTEEDTRNVRAVRTFEDEVIASRKEDSPVIPELSYYADTGKRETVRRIPDVLSGVNLEIRTIEPDLSVLSLQEGVSTRAFQITFS